MVRPGCRLPALLIIAAVLVLARAPLCLAQGGLGNLSPAASSRGIPGEEGFSPRRGYSSLQGVPGGRASLTSWRAFSSTLQRETEGETMQLGPVAVRLGVGAQVVFDSNINASPDDPIADIILVPSFQIGMNWPITRRNSLEINLDISYQYYLLNPGYADSGFTISPGSDIEFNVFTGDFIFTLYNYPTVTTGPAEDDPALTNTGFFRQVDNRFGLRFLWDWNKIVTTGGIERADVFTLDGAFDSLNSTSYSVFLQSSYLFTPTISLGPKLQVTTEDFTSRTLNNAVLSEFGFFIDMRLSVYTTIYAEAGVQSGVFANDAPTSDTITFDVDSQGFNTNVESTLGGGNYLQPYFILGAANRLNRYLNHDLFLSRRVSSSSVANYQEQYTLAYGIQYQLNRVTTLDLLASLAAGNISSSSAEAPAFFEGYGRAGLGFNVARDVTLGLSYEYLMSNLSGVEERASYTRQRITLRMQWTF